ncbi:MAG: hypothetical protein JNJ45_12645 [Chthonomonas sp.]|nr:hypothetical protein [Chthonomonas sp.]
MNSSKAREHFSDYYEGSLDAHLLRGFEAELERNPTLQREWSQFVEAMESLNELRDVPVQVPADLNERISMRLDRHIWEAKQAPEKVSFLSGWWRSLALGGVAATALVATLLTLNQRSANYTAGMGEGQSPLSVRAVGEDLEIIAQSRNSTRLVVRDVTHSTEIKVIEVNRQRVRSVIDNGDASGRIISVSLGDYDKTLVIAFPGTVEESRTSGSVAEFSMAVATARRAPVVVDVSDLAAKVTWTSDLKSMKLEAKPVGFQVQSRSGVLYLVADEDISAR